MSIGQIENRRTGPQGNKSVSRRPVPQPSRRAEDYADEMRAQSLRAQAKMARMAKMLLAQPEPEPAPEPEPEPAIPDVPELSTIAMSDQQSDAEFDALIARLEEMRVDNDPSKGHRIAHAVAKAYGYTFKQLRTRRRHQRLVRARQHAMWAMKTHTTLSYPAIGKILGDLDHTTVLHGVRRHQARIDAGEISAV